MGLRWLVGTQLVQEGLLGMDWELREGGIAPESSLREQKDNDKKKGSDIWENDEKNAHGKKEARVTIV